LPLGVPFGTATAKTSVVGGHCPHCQRPLIKIDCYGERLIDWLYLVQ